MKSNLKSYVWSDSILLIKPIEKAYNGLKEAEESLEEEMKC